MAVILASTAGAGTSSDVVVAAGTPVTIFLASATSEFLPQDAKAVIEIKSAGGTYNAVPGCELTWANPQKKIDSPGTYRVLKYASSTAITIEQT